MSRLSLSSTSQDFLINLKRITRKLLNNQKNKNYKELGHNPEKKILNNLFYALSGLQTSYIHIYEDNIKIHPDYKKPELLKPFESLILNLIKFNDFIFKFEYSSDPIKRELVSILDLKIDKYLKSLLNLRNCSFEELYVSLQPFIYEFDELGIILEQSMNLFGIDLLNFFIDRNNRTVSFNFYNEIIEKSYKIYELDVGFFIFTGNINSEDFMIKKRNVFKFDESIWSDGFKINKKMIPDKFKNNVQNILEAGKITFLIKKIEKLDEKNLMVNRERILKYFDNLEINEFSNINDNEKNIDDFKEINLDDFNGENLNKKYDLLKNIEDFNLKYVLKKFKFDSKSLEKYLEVQKNYFNQIILESLNEEWEIIKKYILQIDSSFISDFLREVDKKLFTNDQYVLKKIDKPKQIEFTIANSTLSTHLRRILRMDQSTQDLKDLNILNSLSIIYNPSQIFKIFFPKKIISELELIFRFIFTLNAINFRFSKLKKNEFINILYNFNNYLLTSLFIPTIFEQTYFKFNNYEEFIINLNLLCKKCLKDLFLTSHRIYEIICDYFDLCFLQSDFDKFEKDKMLRIIEMLVVELEKENGNLFLSLQLERFKDVKN